MYDLDLMAPAALSIVIPREPFSPASFPERPHLMPSMWQRYYTRWLVATRERLDLQLLDLMPR